jgi:hypothetical protein
MKQYQKLTILECEKIKKFLGLNEYTVEYEWENNEGLNGHPAGSSFDYRYLTISLRFSKEFEGNWKELGDKWVAQTLMHELCHFFTYFFDEPLEKHLGKKEYKFYDEKDEQSVERLSKLLYNLYK